MTCNDMKSTLPLPPRVPSITAYRLDYGPFASRKGGYHDHLDHHITMLSQDFPDLATRHACFTVLGEKPKWLVDQIDGTDAEGRGALVAMPILHRVPGQPISSDVVAHYQIIRVNWVQDKSSDVEDGLWACSTARLFNRADFTANVNDILMLGANLMALPGSDKFRRSNRVHLPPEIIRLSADSTAEPDDREHVLFSNDALALRTIMGAIVRGEILRLDGSWFDDEHYFLDCMARALNLLAPDQRALMTFSAGLFSPPDTIQVAWSPNMAGVTRHSKDAQRLEEAGHTHLLNLEEEQGNTTRKRRLALPNLPFGLNDDEDGHIELFGLLASSAVRADPRLLHRTLSMLMTDGRVTAPGIVGPEPDEQADASSTRTDFIAPVAHTCESLVDLAGQAEKCRQIRAMIAAEDQDVVYTLRLSLHLLIRQYGRRQPAIRQIISTFVPRSGKQAALWDEWLAVPPDIRPAWKRIVETPALISNEYWLYFLHLVADANGRTQLFQLMLDMGSSRNGETMHNKRCRARLSDICEAFFNGSEQVPKPKSGERDTVGERHTTAQTTGVRARIRTGQCESLHRTNQHLTELHPINPHPGGQAATTNVVTLNFARITRY